MKGDSLASGLATNEASIDPSVLRPLLEALGESADFATKLLEAFTEAVTERVLGMRRAAETGDDETVSRHAHGLRGSAAQVGAVRLNLLCEHLEQTPSVASGLTELLEAEGQRAIRELRVVLSRGREE